MGLTKHDLVQKRIHNNRWRKHQLRSEFLNHPTPVMERVSRVEDKTRVKRYLYKSYKKEFALEKSKPPKPKISKKERLTLKSLQGGDNILILSADKGNATVS